MTDVVLAPQVVNAGTWRRATEIAARTGAISEWFAGRLREPREMELMPFDAARMGAALQDHDDAEVAEVGRFLVEANGTVACVPRALAEERARRAEPPPPAAAPVVAARPSTVAAAGPQVAPPAPVAPPRNQSALRRLVGPAAGALFLIIKFAAKAKVLLLLLAKGKLGVTMLSSVVSIGAYALLFGWWFGVLFVALLLVHELGHVVVAKAEGVPVSAPMLIPFLGAVVALKQAPKDAWSEAKIALGGPILGSLGAAALLVVAEAQHSDILRAAAYTGFFLNLFNLLPITPLDGGRAAAALHPLVWGLGAVGLVAMIAVFPNPILILIAFIGMLDAWRRYKAFRTGGEESQRYYAVTRWQRVAVAGVYFALAALLVVGMGQAHVVV